MAKGILKYKMVTRINPQNKSEQPKWYAKAVQDRTIDFERLTLQPERKLPIQRANSVKAGPSRLLTAA